MGHIDTRVRPVLFLDKTFYEFKLGLLRHILTGFADKGISSAVVVGPDSDVHDFAGDMTHVIVHPAFKLPFLWGYNRKILIDNLNRFKPTVLHCLGWRKFG